MGLKERLLALAAGERSPCYLGENDEVTKKPLQNKAVPRVTPVTSKKRKVRTKRQGTWLMRGKTDSRDYY